MPMAEAERLSREPEELSNARVKVLPIEKCEDKREDSPFYKPDLTSSEKDGEMVSTGITPDIPTKTE